MEFTVACFTGVRCSFEVYLIIYHKESAVLKHRLKRFVKRFHSLFPGILERYALLYVA